MRGVELRRHVWVRENKPHRSPSGGSGEGNVCPALTCNGCCLSASHVVSVHPHCDLKRYGHYLHVRAVEMRLREVSGQLVKDGLIC